MDSQRLRDIARLIEGERPRARCGEAVVRLSHAVEEGPLIRSAQALHDVEALDEGRLGSGDLVVVGVVAGEEGHRSVVALGRHLVFHAPRPVDLLLQTRELGHPVRHVSEDHQVKDAHQEDQEGADQESGQQLRVNARLNAGCRIDKPAEQAPGNRPLERWAGRLPHHAAPVELAPPRESRARGPVYRPRCEPRAVRRKPVPLGT